MQTVSIMKEYPGSRANSKKVEAFSASAKKTNKLQCNNQALALASSALDP
jgi:hypothetical protein